MSMGNNTLLKLNREFTANYEWNAPFRSYVDSLGIMYHTMYGVDQALPKDMKKARQEWKKNHKVWYLDSWEAGESIDAMPFGGWKSEQEEADFLKTLR